MKMTSENKLAELTDFENVLDTFGGNPARWPEARRERLLSLVASDGRAQRLLREAEALDAVLTRAAGPPVGNTAALADRIAAAIANPDAVRPLADRLNAAANPAGPTTAKGKAGVVIAWPRSGSGSNTGSSANRAAQTAAPSGPQPRRDRSTWRAAAMLAASLLVGVFVGAMDFVPGNVSNLVAGIEVGSDTPRELALLQGDDLLDFFEESSR